MSNDSGFPWRNFGNRDVNAMPAQLQPDFAVGGVIGFAIFVATVPLMTICLILLGIIFTHLVTPKASIFPRQRIRIRRHRSTLLTSRLRGSQRSHPRRRPSHHTYPAHLWYLYPSLWLES